MELHSPGQPPAALGTPRRTLPALDRLARLTALNLADNCFARVPPELAKLSGLRVLDLSINADLQVRRRPLASWSLLCCKAPQRCVCPIQCAASHHLLHTVLL